MGSCVFTPDLKTPIVVWIYLEVPSFHWVDTPRSPLARFFVDLHFTTHQCQWHPIEILWTKRVGLYWKFWRHIWLVEDITGEFCLWYQTIPQIHWKVICDPTKNIFKISIESLCFFSPHFAGASLHVPVPKAFCFLRLPPCILWRFCYPKYDFLEKCRHHLAF